VYDSGVSIQPREAEAPWGKNVAAACYQTGSGLDIREIRPRPQSLAPRFTGRRRLQYGPPLEGFQPLRTRSSAG
jgi:hypothetical protein